MTLKVRIEKADATDFIATVREEYRNAETGEWEVPDSEIGMVFEDKEISWPAQSREFTIWDGKRLVITETGSNNMLYTNRPDYIALSTRAIEAEQRVKELEEFIRNIPDANQGKQEA